MNAPTKSTARRISVWLWYWLPPIVWLGVIFYLSSQPHLPSAQNPLLDTILKKLGHATEFALLFVLFLRAWRQARPEGQVLGISCLATIAYAASDELHQAFVAGRHCTWNDFSIDVSGALLLWCLLLRRHRLFSAEDEDLAK